MQGQKTQDKTKENKRKKRKKDPAFPHKRKKRKNMMTPPFERIVMWVVLIGCIVALVIKLTLYIVYVQRSQNDIGLSNDPKVPINESIHNCACQDSDFSLRDYYIYASYNSAIEGPYATPTVSLRALSNVIKQGVRFLDFEIYSSYADSTPMVSCSTLTEKQGNKCGVLVETAYLLPFRSCMQMIRDYALTNSGCMNFNDPLIINLRLKTCQPEVAKQLASIFDDFSDIMLGPQYSFNDNRSNFGATKISELVGKVCVFVESENMEYTSVPEFMEYVNLSKPTQFLRLMPISEFSLIGSLEEFTDENKRNMTIVTPNPTESDPNNITVQALQNAGVQIVALMFWKKDSYLQNAMNYFNQNAAAFVLKPEKFRFSNIVIPAAIEQNKRLSYQERNIATPIPNVMFKI